MTARRSLPWLAPALAGLVLLSGCRSDPEAGTPPAPSSKPSAKPVDRLAPGEMAPGKDRVFGFEVPRGMSVRGSFKEVAYLDGEVSPEALANYVRDRVEVSHVEIGAARTVFPMARIKSGPPDRYYQLEVVAQGRRSELVIRDVTPRPRPPAETISDEERWRRAGRRPDGTPLDIRELR